MVRGRSAQELREWMQARGAEFTQRVGVVAMDAFAGWKHAVESVVPHAVEAGDTFHLVQLAAARVTKVRCRLQRDATGRRGVKGDRLFDCRRALLTSDPTTTSCSPTTPTKGSYTPTGATTGDAANA